MAKAKGVNARVSLHIARKHCHGVGVVQQQRVGANLFHVSGEIRTVSRYLFIFEGFESYHPSPTELGLAEVGDEYIVVAYATKPTLPARLYRADTYLWDEALDI